MVTILLNARGILEKAESSSSSSALTEKTKTTMGERSKNFDRGTLVIFGGLKFDKLFLGGFSK